jgi:hypothetical protein
MMLTSGENRMRGPLPVRVLLRHLLNTSPQIVSKLRLGFANAVRAKFPRVRGSSCQQLEPLIRDGSGEEYRSFIDPMRQELAVLLRRLESH